MIKFYIPDGHLEKKTLELFRRAGFDVSISSRSYNPEIDDPKIELKKLRPHDFPFVVGMGKGDVAITGSDILEEFCMANPRIGKNITKLMDLGFGKTRLAVAVSEDVMPGVKSVEDLKKIRDSELVVATEYPNIAGEYLKKKGINAVTRKPAGKTEAWIIPPDPEADIIIDTVETGSTLIANRCRILDNITDAQSVLIANKKSLKNKEKKRKIDEIIQLFRGALRAKGKVNVYLNILDAKNLDTVLNVMKKYVKNPTISTLKGGGYDVFAVMDESGLKYILPQLIKNGASSIAISDTRLILE